MPGVNIRTTTATGPASNARDAAATYFVAGITERGPVAGKRPELRSLADYVRHYGARVNYGALYDNLRTYFEEGGVRAFVARTVGPAATVGTRALLNDAGPAVATLRIDAASPGDWSARVDVAVDDGALPDTFTLTILFDDVVVETWRDLVSGADAAAQLSRSAYVRATDLGAGIPAAAGAAALSAGTDDRGAVTAAHHVAALNTLGEELGTGLVAIPGQPSGTVGVGLAAHAVATQRVAITSVVPGSSPGDAEAAAGALIAALPAGHAPYVGMAYPAVRIPDAGGVVRTITPEGYVAAVRCRAVAEEGPWRAPAGAIAAARFVVGTERDIDRATGDSLDAAHVSAIRQIGGTTRLYGWRSMSLDESSYRLLSSRDVLNLIQVAAAEILEEHLFATIDGSGRLLAIVNGELVGILEPIARAGGLFALGDDDPGYRVDTGPGVNPPEQLAANRLAAVLGARPSPTAEIIDLTIVRAAATS